VYVLKGKLHYRRLIGCLNLALADADVGGADNGTVVGAIVSSAYPRSRESRIDASTLRVGL